MAQDFYARYPYLYNNETNAVRYINNTMPFYFGIASEGSEWTGNEQYPNTSMSECTPYRQPMPSSPTLTLPKEQVQLVPDNPIQIVPIVSERLTAVSWETISPTSACFANPNGSLPALNHPHLKRPFNPAYQDGDVFFPCSDTTPSIALAPPMASNPSSPSTNSISTSRNSPTSECFESETAIDPLPLLKLPYGAWKCMLCGQQLRRKQRAVVHYWSKHSDVRLNCSGRCGSVDCHKSFTSQDAIDLHLNPVLVDCSFCGRSLLKKNIKRHMVLHCRPASQ